MLDQKRKLQQVNSNDTDLTDLNLIAGEEVRNASSMQIFNKEQYDQLNKIG